MSVANHQDGDHGDPGGLRFRLAGCQTKRTSNGPAKDPRHGAHARSRHPHDRDVLHHFPRSLTVVLGFGGDGLSDSGIQLSLATFIVLGSVWCLAFMDDGMQDMMAGLSDLDGFETSAMGQRLAKQPIVIFRVVNVVFVGLIVAAELMAIY